MSALFTSICRNLFEHVAYIQACTPGMRVERHGEWLLADSGFGTDTFNKIVCPDRMALDKERTEEFQALLAVAGRRFSGLERQSLFPLADAFSPQVEGKRAFSIWTGTEHPENEGRLCSAFELAGYRKTEEEQAMFLHFSQVSMDNFQERHGIRITPVRTLAEIDAFARVMGANWTPPDMEVPLFFRRGAKALLKERSPMRLFLAFAGEEPVGCGELFLSEGGAVAGLHMVATLKAWRGRGVGSTMTTALLMAGRAAGAGRAVLLASEEGAPVYSRQGFAACGKFFEFSPAEEDVLF